MPDKVLDPKKVSESKTVLEVVDVGGDDEAARGHLIAHGLGALAGEEPPVAQEQNGF